MLSEIFGDENFVATFAWEKRTNRENRTTVSYLGNEDETLDDRSHIAMLNSTVIAKYDGSEIARVPVRQQAGREEFVEPIRRELRGILSNKGENSIEFRYFMGVGVEFLAENGSGEDIPLIQQFTRSDISIVREIAKKSVKRLRMTGDETTSASNAPSVDSSKSSVGREVSGADNITASNEFVGADRGVPVIVWSGFIVIGIVFLVAGFVFR